jgi:hypothetical protein
VPECREVQNSSRCRRICQLRSFTVVSRQRQNHRSVTVRSTAVGLLQLGRSRLRQSLSQSVPELALRQRVQLQTYTERNADSPQSQRVQTRRPSRQWNPHGHQQYQRCRVVESKSHRLHALLHRKYELHAAAHAGRVFPVSLRHRSFLQVQELEKVWLLPSQVSIPDHFHLQLLQHHLLSRSALQVRHCRKH